MSLCSNARNANATRYPISGDTPWSMILQNPPKILAVGASGKFAGVVLGPLWIGLAKKAPDAFWLTPERLLAALAKVATERVDFARYEGDSKHA